MTSLLVRLCAVLALAGAIALALANARVAASGDKVTPTFAHKLATIPGKSLSVLTVDYAPGDASPPHRHADSAEIFAYVVSGSVRSKVNDEPERVYKAGEFWYEPPGALHSVSANASTTEAARTIAVIVADTGATLTTYEK